MVYCRFGLFLSFFIGAALAMVLGMLLYHDTYDHINIIANITIALATIAATFISFFIYRSNLDSRRWEINKHFLLGFSKTLTVYIEQTGRDLDERIDRHSCKETTKQLKISTEKINRYLLLANEAYKPLLSKKLLAAIETYKENVGHLGNENDIGALGEIDYIEGLYTEQRKLQTSLVKELKNLARIK